MDTLELCENIFKRFENKHALIENYYGLLAYYALSQTAIEKNDPSLIKKCTDYLELYPEKYPHPSYNFEPYRVGGNGKAWMFMKGVGKNWESDLRKYAEITLESPKNEDGILCHGKTGKIWIDVVTCITPFMLFVGLALNEEKYIDFAVDQFIKMYDCLMDKEYGLLHQAKGFIPENPEKVSEDHWSRGNGWGYLGLAELIRYLPKDSKHRAKVENYFIEHSRALITHQDNKGLWRQEIPEELSWCESSGTGLILYGLGIGLRKGVLQGDEYRSAFNKGIEALAKYCLYDDFSTHLSCPGCMTPGTGEDKGTPKSYITLHSPKSDESHSYGCIMLALLEAKRNGITDISISECWGHKGPNKIDVKYDCESNA